MFSIRRPPVHRSSESFAALAAALAKAQAHLVNPEKSLTATIRPARPGETARSFRYAPLSSGLEIVRKTLSEHEIAVIQTTAVDQASRMLNLTTLLAHSSGEWIASYWPVCSVAEVANPHRMGAALTYARRYALFTLVGIAGEDDLDAPDLCAPAPMSPAVGAGSSKTNPAISPAQLPGALRLPPHVQGNGQARGSARAVATPVLSAEDSAALRDRLLTEIAALQSEDSTTKWARHALAAKNRLTAEDAKLLEDAFERKLSEFLSVVSDGGQLNRDVSQSDGVENQDIGPVNEGNSNDSQPVHTAESQGIDKSVLALSTPRRYRNKDHLRFVTRQPCLLCGRKPSDPHHIRFVQPRALGRKPSDEFTVPLCRSHHRSVHRAGNEQVWWQQAGIDPLKIARKLWKHTRTDEGRIKPDPAGTPAIASNEAAEPETPAPSTQAPI
jgi:hypothetical protein